MKISVALLIHLLILLTFLGKAFKVASITITTSINLTLYLILLDNIIKIYSLKIDNIIKFIVKKKLTETPAGGLSLLKL